MDDIAAKLRDYGLTLQESVVICDRRVVDEAATLIEAYQSDADAHVSRLERLRRQEDEIRDLKAERDALRSDNARLAKELEEARKALEDEHRQFLAVGNMYVGKCFELHQARSATLEEAAQTAEECNISMGLIIGGPDGASIARRQIAAAIRHKATVTTDDLPEGGQSGD